MWTNSCGPRIERSTCVSAAKLTIAVAPGGSAGDGVRIGDVPLEELVLDPVEVRRVARVGELVEDDDVGRRPRASRRTKCEPMKPAPPVTSTRIGTG